jgi:hypothetical protein
LHGGGTSLWLIWHDGPPQIDIERIAARHGVTLVIRGSRAVLARKSEVVAIYHPVAWLSIGLALVIFPERRIYCAHHLHRALGGPLMVRLVVCCLLLLLVGCGKKDRAGSKDLEAIMKGQPTTYWIEQLTNTDEEKRTVAVKLLVEYGKKDETVVEDLADALETKTDSDLLIAICGVLERIGLNADTKDVITNLKKLIRKDERVAQAAGKALLRLNKDEARNAGVAPPPVQKK